LALYNLAIDPGEDRDQKDQYPEIVKQLQQVAYKYCRTLGDGLNNMQGTEIRPAAQL